MRSETRWGEVTIKKQGGKKNQFDKTKSFSVLNSQKNYDIDDFKDILELTTDLTETLGVQELKKELNNLVKKYV